MFTPRAFAEHDLVWLDRLLERDPFVTLLTTGTDWLPELTRLPVLYVRDGERIELQGHWAKANAQARHAGTAKVLVDGPHGKRAVARGAVDDKGQVMTWLEALRFWHETAGGPPCRITVMVEGE